MSAAWIAALARCEDQVKSAFNGPLRLSIQAYDRF